MRNSILIFLFVSVIMKFVHADSGEFKITIKEDGFYPSETTIPAGQRVKLLIQNDSSFVEEFDSYELNREKVVEPGNTVEIYIGPLNPGIYHFQGEFHSDKLQGTVIVK